MKRFVILVSCILCCTMLSAQTIDFVSTEYDYGNIKEDDGVAYHEFEFVNNGTAPLIIQKVNSSCGCTTPEWSKAPVAPGKSGKIKVGYNASGRPNKFSKTITVISNAKTQSVILRIKGFVIPHVKTLDEIYTLPVGDLRFAKMHISFGRMLLESSLTDTIKFLNRGLMEVKVDVNNKGRNFVEFRTQPEVVKPNEIGNIIVTYYPKLRNDWGFVNDRFMVTVNDKTENHQQISVSGTIEEDYSKFTDKQLADAPIAQFNTQVYDFGDAYPEGTPVEFDFVLTNAGKSDLIIRKVKASCGCTSVNPTKNVLKPGESSVIKARFSTSGYSGRQSKSITVITNDPKKSTVALRLTGTVEKDKSKVGVVSINQERIDFKNAYVGKVYSDTITYKNIGKVDVKLQIEENPEFASFSFIPQVVKPEQVGKIAVKYIPEKRNDWGKVNDLFILKVNGVRQDRKLMLCANIVEDFSALDKKQLKNAPKAVVASKELKFNPDSPKLEFSLTNKGREALIIHKVYSTSGVNEIDIKLPKTTLAAGESVTIGVDFKKKNLDSYSGKIEIITNDPQQPTLVLSVVASN